MSPKLTRKLYEALKLAHTHLEYCGYGDKWERECAYHSRVPEQITEALEAYHQECEQPKRCVE